MDFIKKLKTKNTFLYILIFLLFISIRIIGLGSDILNTDAERWHRRSENFLNAMRQRNYIETYQRYHPGVTLMWFNSIVKYISSEYQLTYTDNPLTLEHADYFVLIHGISKAFNVLALAVLLGIQLFFISRIFNNKVALLYALLISVEPYMIGINRWFHQTSFEVFFGFTSLLSLLYWYKNGKIQYIILSAFFLVFSVLAKITSLILGPVLLVIFVSKFIKDKKVDIRLVFLYGFFVFGFIFLFFPALWVDPLFVFNKIYGHVFNAVTDNVRAEMLTGWLSYLYYVVILLFKLSPFTVFVFLISIVNLRKTSDFNVKVMIFSILNYYVFTTLTDQKIDRYSLIFFPFIILLISIYISNISRNFITAYLSLSLLFLGYVIYIYHPVYSAYYSPLFGSTKGALNVGVYDNSGEYFAQAALYLNTKGRDINTYVPNGFSSFDLFYKGNTQRDRNENTNYVVTSYDMQRLNPADDICTTLDNSFGSKEYELVFVWKCFEN